MKHFFTLLFLAIPSLTHGQTPGEFIYDPVTGKSEPARDATSLTEVATDLSPVESFTIEAFAKLAAAPDFRPREHANVFSIAGAESFSAGFRRSSLPHSYHWWQAEIRQEGVKPIELSRNRYRGLTMIGKEMRWRHVSFTWDSASKVAACYLDYQLLNSTNLEKTPQWDLSTIKIGGRNEGRSNVFPGSVHSVRATKRTLKPWEFLRASKSALENVSFAPEATPKLPDGYGHVNVRLHYGAVGDGVHDDTDAIRRAFAANENRVPIEYNTIYFPEGTYLISDSLQFSRFMVVRGAGRDKSIIRLKDSATGYDDPAVPKPAFAVGYDWPTVGRTKRMKAGNVIGNYIFDIGIDTGKGNPAALGLDFHCNNIGCVENVSIRSGDGKGVAGLDLRRPWPGPCLIKNVSITGFDLGIAAAHREYSLVFSGIELEGQQTAAIDNSGNLLSMENVVSRNQVPAIQNRSGGLVVMINSKLLDGDSSTTAVDSQNASVYLRNVEIAGYGNGVVERRAVDDGAVETLAELPIGKINEHFTGPFASSFPTKAEGSLKLPIKQTPDTSRPPVEQWANVRDFEHLVDNGDWAPAIQAAIDSGKPVVYFPQAKGYVIRQNVIVRGKTRSFFGGSPKLTIDNESKESPQTGAAIVIEESVQSFDIEMLHLHHVRHEGPSTFVVRHAHVEDISTSSDTGELFIEDSGGKWRFDKNQTVWGRQMNPETKGIPEIINNGGSLWVLGLKTEYLSTKIVNQAGAKTEVLGGLMYPVHAVTDPTLPMFINEDSDISLIHGVSAYNRNHKIYMRDTQNGATQEHTKWPAVGRRTIVNLYRSDKKD